MDAPPIQYTRTSDGVNIAYWTLGEGPPLLIVNLPVMSHLQREWEVETLRKFYEGLASRFQLIRFSTRNAGLSDRNVEHLGLHDYVKHVEAVVGACTDSPIAIVAQRASPLVVQYAAQFPERVSALTTINGGVRFPVPIQGALTAIATASNEFWIETIVNLFDPAGSDSESLVRLVRDSVDADDRPRLTQELYRTWDVSDVLSDVVAPTLVIYSPTAVGEIDRGSRELASLIPNSRLLVRQFDRITLADTLSAEVVSIIADFVDEAVGRTDEEHEDVAQASGLRTILFTDLESSTALTQAVGDAKAQDILHGHNDVVRAALAAHDGEEVKHTGDGIMASFGSAVAAVEAALVIQRELAGGEVRVRVGLNAGEPIHEEGDYFGGSVQLAARVCDRAEPGQVLVSNVVRELCTGKMFQFADQGEATLKGFPEPVRLFTVTPPEGVA